MECAVHFVIPHSSIVNVKVVSGWASFTVWPSDQMAIQLEFEQQLNLRLKIIRLTMHSLQENRIDDDDDDDGQLAWGWWDDCSCGCHDGFELNRDRHRCQWIRKHTPDCCIHISIWISCRQHCILYSNEENYHVLLANAFYFICWTLSHPHEIPANLMDCHCWCVSLEIIVGKIWLRDEVDFLHAPTKLPTFSHTHRSRTFARWPSDLNVLYSMHTFVVRVTMELHC